jgi:hypothetical protein
MWVLIFFILGLSDAIPLAVAMARWWQDICPAHSSGDAHIGFTKKYIIILKNKQKYSSVISKFFPT